MQALRRRRNEVSVELRKAKKDEALSKRRNLGPAYDSDSDTPLSPLQEQDANRANTAAAALSLEDIARVITTSDNPEECYNVRQGHCALFALLLYSIFFFFSQATLAARKFLSREKNPPIDMLVEANVVPR